MIKGYDLVSHMDLHYVDSAHIKCSKFILSLLGLRFFDSLANENERGQDNYDTNSADESDGNGQSDTVDEIEHGFR